MKENIDDIITRILSGESTPEENLCLINWLNLSQNNVDEFYGKERVWNAITVVFTKEKYNDQTAYDKFIRDIGRSDRKYSKDSGIKKFLTRTLHWAAIGLILIGFGSLFYYIINNQKTSLKADIYEIIVPMGSKSNLILTDGTSVWLNAGSRFSYSKNFGETDRSVHLEGEGFFQVEKENKHPFTVITSEVEVVALGTSFNVKSYPDEDVIQTTLVLGSILVNRIGHMTTEKGLNMEPNQQLTYYREARQMKLSSTDNENDKFNKAEQSEIQRTADAELPRAILSRGVDPEIFTSWKDNKLILDDETFESIAIKLQRRFGTNIIIQDEDIRSRRFTGRFDEITMEQALNALQFVSPFDYYLDNDTIFISSK